MASNFPHEDSPDLGREKSEQSFKDWDKYWQAVQNNRNEGFLDVNLGECVGDATAAPSKGVGESNRRWLFALRHGERVDLTYGPWTQHCFDQNDTYIRKDLNLPLKLGERAGGSASYALDSPLTRVGRLQAELVGEGLRLAGAPVHHVYSSAALRCVETAHHMLQGLQADPSIKIRVEPGLFEYKMWHRAKGLAPFMTPEELHKAGYNVDLDYKPYVTLDVDSDETLQEFFKRNELVITSAAKDTQDKGGNIIYVGHAATLDLMVLAFKHLKDRRSNPTYDIHNNLLRVPYCALGAMRAEPYEVVCPPCPPAINSSSGRFDWKMLLEL